MIINRPELSSFGRTLDLPLTLTHRSHMQHNFSDFLSLGNEISRVGGEIGSEAAIRSGSLSDTMLRALDSVSAQQQFASALHQQAILDPNSVDVHDITIAQAQARMTLDIARSVLNRVVQGWRDIINTR